VTPGGLVLVVGSANIDVAARVSRLPLPGETVLGEVMAQAPGGKGLNQAIAARRAGADVDFRAAIGTGGSGDWLLDQLRAEGVYVDHVDRPPGPPGTALVIVDAEGENQIVVDPGSNGHASGHLVTAAPARPPKVVLVQCEIPHEAVLAALCYGRTVAATTVLNAAPATTLAQEIVDAVDVLVVNEHEYAAARGEPAGGAVEPVLGWPTIVVTQGARGALIVRTSGSVLVPAPKVHVVDTVAAGDAFCGALAAALARGEALEEAVRWGCAAGALTVTRPGAAAALPTAEELRRFTETAPSRS
jgi:ribokinase